MHLMAQQNVLIVKILNVKSSARLQHINADMIIFWKLPTRTKHSFVFFFPLKHFYLTSLEMHV